MMSYFLLATVFSMMGNLANAVTEADLDRKLGPGMKHVSCGTRVTGLYMRRHCKNHFNAPLKCNLDSGARHKVKKVAKLCCEDAPSCDSATLFSEFCCVGPECDASLQQQQQQPDEEEHDCQPWDDAVEEIELANLMFSSDQLFENIQERILGILRIGQKPPFLPELLKVYSENPSLIEPNEAVIRRYFKSHRLQTAYIAKSLGFISESNKIVDF